MSTETQGGGLLPGDVLTAEERAYMEGGPAPQAEPSPTAPPPATDDTARATDGQQADTDGDTDLDDDDTDSETARDENGRFVSRSALLRVKEREKQTREALSKVAVELIRRRERDAVFSELAARQGQPEVPAAEKDIDPTEDIFGAYTQLAKKFQALESRLSETDQNVRQTFEAQSLQQMATRDMQTFSAKEPAFLDAYKYLEGQRHAELEALGIADPQQRQEIVRREARELVQGALKSNASGAERIFRLAQARGFKPQTAPDVNTAASETIERINKGKAAAQSLRNAGGTSDVGQALTPQKLADMSDKEFSATRTAYIKKHGAHAWDKLIGGG